jgi:hypothetical protein
MGFLDLLDPSDGPEFFWQVISGPPCIFPCLVATIFGKQASLSSMNEDVNCAVLSKSDDNIDNEVDEHGWGESK